MAYISDPQPKRPCCNLTMNTILHPQVYGSGQKRATHEDWERNRLHFQSLYFDENRTLKEVMTIMAEQYGHHGTEKMYKTRIKKWMLDKKNKRCDMLSILRKTNGETAVPKETRFRVRRRVVTYDDVLRYFKRTGGIPELPMHEATSPPHSLYQEAISTPATSNVSELCVARLDVGSHNILTRPLSLAPPLSLLILEDLFSSIKIYFDGSFSSKNWVHDEGNGCCIYVGTTVVSVDKVHQLRDYCRMTVMFIKTGSSMQIRRALSRACSLVRDILKSHEPTASEILLHALLILIREGFTDVACFMLKYISAVASQLYLSDQSRHPLEKFLGKFWNLLGRVSADNIEAAAVRSWHCIHDSFKKHLSPLHRTTSHSYLKLLEVAHTGDMAMAERTLRTRLAAYTRVVGRSDPRVLNLMACLGNNLYLQQRYYEAEDMAEDILKRGSKINGSIAEICALQLMAEAQHKLDRREVAERNLKEAVRRIRIRWHNSHPWATRELVRMKAWLQGWGRERDANKLDHEINGLIGKENYEEEFEAQEIAV